MDGSRERRASRRLGGPRAVPALIGVMTLLAFGPLAAQDGDGTTTAPTGDDVAQDDGVPEVAPRGDAAPEDERPGEDAADDGGRDAVDGAGAPTRGATIPRDVIVDMTRSQAGIICSSEIFLGCMGFDGGECLALSESAIDRCLMTLPPAIDPVTLDNATLEACPRAIYEEAGYVEEQAQACFEGAIDGS